MADNTKIEWADATLNYVNGCTVHSPGCTNCYAMKQAHRFPVRQGLTVKTKGGMVWTGEVRDNESALRQALAWKRGRRIFWNAHGDLFHKDVPDVWIDRQFAACAMTPQHTHMILTKRSDRMRQYFEARREGDPWAEAADYVADLAGIDEHPWVLEPGDIPLRNVWLGVSVEDQQRANERIPDLLATPAAIRFLSVEPMLGPIDLTHIDDQTVHAGFTVSALTGWGGFDYPIPGPQSSLPKVQLVIAGGESGPKARPMHPAWVRSIRDQCREAQVAFHFKQWGEWVPGGHPAAVALAPFTMASAARAMTKGGQFEDGQSCWNVGKKAAGRVLDGRTHDEFPAVAHG